MGQTSHEPVHIGDTLTDLVDGIHVREGTLGYAIDTDTAYRYSGTAWVQEDDPDTVQAALDTHIADAADAHTEITTLNTYKPAFSTLTADSADIQNDTFTDSGLVVTLPIAGTYTIEALLFYTTAAAADIQFKFVAVTATITGTVGTSDIAVINAPGGDATAARVPTLVATSWTTAQALTTTGAPADASPAFYKGKLVATVAGTVKIQFAQGTTDATNTHVGAGSYFMAQRVA